MKKLLFIFLLIVFLMSSCAPDGHNLSLSSKQQNIIAIAVFTAEGNLDKLKTALNEGLDSGLSINEIKEVLIQLYAYTGFPRSLNAINTFEQAAKERKEKGINDVLGLEASPMPSNLNKNAYGTQMRNRLMARESEGEPSGYQLFTPVMDQFIKEHFFADIFFRDNLDILSRELANLGALAGISGTQKQLAVHFNIAMNVGLTRQQAQDFILVLKQKAGRSQAARASAALKKVLATRKE